jgi:hypothetical protein
VRFSNPWIWKETSTTQLETLRWEHVPFSLYSPDSAPSDFNVFRKLKKKISEAGDFHLTTPSKPKYRNGFGSRTSPFTARAWEIL